MLLVDSVYVGVVVCLSLVVTIGLKKPGWQLKPCKGGDSEALFKTAFEKLHLKEPWVALMIC